MAGWSHPVSAHHSESYPRAAALYAKELAEKENCYKMMLLTGSKEESTLWFYEQAGYNRKDKTAFSLVSASVVTKGLSALWYIPMWKEEGK